MTQHQIKEVVLCADDYGRHMQSWLSSAPTDKTALITYNPAVSA